VLNGASASVCSGQTEREDTTIEILEGLLVDEGEVEVLGLHWDAHERDLRQRLGIQLAETQLAEKLSVEETLRLFRSFYHRGRSIDDLLAVVELESKRRSLVGKLSGGQKQRLSVACALAGGPEPALPRRADHRPRSCRRGGSCGPCSPGSARKAAPS
jgi:ABC-type Na+ transport system ATPase subunit NatA